ncbi:MAG: class I SAM-dependent rRNA methyltransferase [Aminobacterium sp.]
MSKIKGAILNRKGLDRLHKRHPWIFKGHLATFPQAEPGDFISLYNNREKIEGWGFWGAGALCIRVLSFDTEKPELHALLRERLVTSLASRKRWLPQASAFRLVHSESDGLPGLIIDIYGSVACMQLLSAGWYRNREMIIGTLLELLPLNAIVLRNDVRYLEQEGIPRENRLLWGTLPEGDSVDIPFYEMQERVYPLAGQKTGIYLDVRNLPNLFKEVCPRADVLDCFSFQGHFGLHALHWGARSITAIEQSQEALSVYEENISLNGLSSENVHFHHGNAFDELRALEAEKKTFDIIIMDPPPFSPGKAQIESARRGYKELALRAYRLLRSEGILLYLCCSHAFSRQMLIDVLSDAAFDTKSTFRIVREGHQPEDHPIALEIPETNYLKGLLIQKTSK